MSGCLGAIAGFVLVMILASAFPGVINNDGWLIIGAFGGGVVGTIAGSMVSDLIRRQDEASIPLISGPRPPGPPKNSDEVVALSRQPITRAESAAVRDMELGAFGFALILAAVGVGAVAIRQVGWAITLGVLTGVSAISGCWTWIQARDKWTVWAVGTIGLSSHRDYTSRSWRRVCTLVFGDKSLEFDCDTYDRLATRATLDENKLLQFQGAVQFLPGSDVALRIESPAGVAIYKRGNHGSTSVHT